MGDQAAGLVLPHPEPADCATRPGGRGHEDFQTAPSCEQELKGVHDVAGAISSHSEESSALITASIAEIHAEVKERVETLGGKLIAENAAVWRQLCEAIHDNVSLEEPASRISRVTNPASPSLPGSPGANNEDTGAGKNSGACASAAARGEAGAGPAQPKTLTCLGPPPSPWDEPMAPLGQPPPRPCGHGRRNLLLPPMPPGQQQWDPPDSFQYHVSRGNGNAAMGPDALPRPTMQIQIAKLNDSCRGPVTVDASDELSSRTVSSRGQREPFFDLADGSSDDESRVMFKGDQDRRYSGLGKMSVGTLNKTWNSLQDKSRYMSRWKMSSTDSMEQDVPGRLPRAGVILSKDPQISSEFDTPPHRGRNVFPDADMLKERLRAAIAKKEYDATEHYADKGICQRIARNPFFEQFSLVVIWLNAIWIAIDMDLNDALLLQDADIHFQIIENLFCIYFTLEWLIRVEAFEKWQVAFQDRSLIFDTCLVVMMIFETWLFQITMFSFRKVSVDLDFGNASMLKVFRIVRLTRMARMLRIFRAMPELVFLVKGLFVAARSVFFTLLLLCIIIYVFSIVFVQLTADLAVGEKYFKNVPTAFTCLLLRGTVPDMAELVYDVSGDSIFLGFFLFMFILLASLTVMNMLVGVLVQVVTVVSTVEKEELMVSHVKSKMMEIIETESLDPNGDGYLNQEEFKEFLLNNRFVQFVNSIGVDVVGLVDLAELIFKDDTEVEFFAFVELLLQLRGTNNATVKDLVDMRKFIVQMVAEMMEAQSHVLLSTLGQVSGDGPASAPVVRASKSLAARARPTQALAEMLSSAAPPDAPARPPTEGVMPSSVPQAMHAPPRRSRQLVVQQPMQLPTFVEDSAWSYCTSSAEADFLSAAVFQEKALGYRHVDGEYHHLPGLLPSSAASAPISHAPAPAPVRTDSPALWDSGEDV